MALNFPLGASFFDGLPVSSCTFDLGEAMQVSGRTAGGAILTSGLGTRLWRGSVTLTPMLARAAEGVRARLNVLREPGRTLFVIPYPVDTPAGGDVTASVTIAALSSNNRELQMSGLPFPLQPGDPLSFEYGANPVRFAFHRVVAVSGNLVEVTPHIRPGAAVGAVVRVMQPVLKALVVPGTVNLGTAQPGGIITGMAFDIQQTLR